MKQILVVGAGFTGAVIARQLAEAGMSVDVIDRRDHVAGNAYDYVHLKGMRIHRYGPHLFHTNMDSVFEYLSRFTEWLEYKHRVKALLADGRYVTLPVNRETKEAVGEENIIDTFYRPYTKKMWGVELEQLDPSIMNRVPVRDDDNDLYFPNDKHQCLPKDGYTALITRMLDHKNIRVALNVEFNRSLELSYDHVFNSMPIDEYYDCEFGPLPYRSIIFHQKVVYMPRALPTATVNFTHDGPYTRVTEWKNLPGNDSADPYDTVLTFEEPCDYTSNGYERYYPVKDIDGMNRARYRKYADIKNDKVTFVGRCGQYVYIDMDQAVNSALKISERFIKND